MISQATDDITLISIRGFINCKAIDGGDTVVIMLEGVGSEVVAVMVPRRVAADMLRSLSDSNVTVDPRRSANAESVEINEC